MFWACNENFDFLSRKYINKITKITINDDHMSISMVEKYLLTPAIKCKSITVIKLDLHGQYQQVKSVG